MSEIKSTIPIKSGVAIGRGKLSICGGNDGRVYVAVVHPDTSVEVIELNDTGHILEANLVDIKELVEVKVNQLQVAWCINEEQKTLIISCTNQIAFVRKKNNLQIWNIVMNAIIPDVTENGLINTLTCDSDNIFIGSNQGLWQIGMDLRRQIHIFKNPVTVAKVSETWLALGQEQGTVSVMRKVNQQWFNYSHMKSNLQTCCTDLLLETKLQALVAAYNTGHIRLFSLMTTDLLYEFAAHIRWINQLIQVNGGFLSTADDSFVHLWKFSGDVKSVDYVNSIQMKNCLVTNGALFTAETDSNYYHTFLLTVYDRFEMYIVSVEKESPIVQ